MHFIYTYLTAEAAALRNLCKISRLSLLKVQRTEILRCAAA